MSCLKINATELLRSRWSVEMDIDTYTKILLKQQESMTPEMLEAIKTQGELHIICEAK